jgi:hypothetical protein
MRFEFIFTKDTPRPCWDSFECCGLVLRGSEDDNGCRAEQETKDLPCGHESCNCWEEENGEKKCRECASEKKAADAAVVSSATSTTVSAPSCHLTCRLIDMSERDLEALHQNIEAELKNRRLADDFVINKLKQACSCATTGR